jgi:hypothetical protein
VFTRTRHCSLSWARWIQSTPSHPISLKSIPILASHLRLDLPGDSSFQVFRPKFCMNFSYHTCYMPHPPHSPWLDDPKNILRSVQVMTLLTLQSLQATVSC